MEYNNKSGIYKITNTLTNQAYIGSSVTLRRREMSHFSTLKLKKHRNQRLQNSYNKYGEANFIFEVICFCEINELLIKEQYYIDIVNPYFNIARIAGHTTGTKRTDEQRLKMSIIQRNMPKEVREAQKERCKNKPFPKVALEAAIKANIGRVVSEETRRKISLANKGRKLSDELKKRLSNAHKNKIISDTHKKNMSLASKNKKKIICLNNSKIYNSIKEACDELNTKPQHISKVLKGKCNHTKGYIFRDISH